MCLGWRLEVQILKKAPKFLEIPLGMDTNQMAGWMWQISPFHFQKSWSSEFPTCFEVFFCFVGWGSSNSSDVDQFIIPLT